MTCAAGQTLEMAEKMLRRTDAKKQSDRCVHCVRYEAGYEAGYMAGYVAYAMLTIGNE
jgi:hypothetical protein